MPTYDTRQTVFTLSMFSNWVSSEVGSARELQQKMAAALNQQFSSEQIQELIGTWDVVWGPVVFQTTSSNVSDNAMYVARGELDGQTTYLIGISGTNPISWFGWLVEDFEVHEQVNWPYGNPPESLQPAIARGTHTGLSILQSMVSPPDSPGGDDTLYGFLKRETSAATTSVSVIASGHSLGGALSPVTALWLADTQSDWDRNSMATVMCSPSAGPTSGNADFAGYYDSTLGSTTDRIWNSLDVVPHAWQRSMLDEVPNLYTTCGIDPTDLIQGLVKLAQAVSLGGKYTQILSDTTPLSGICKAGLTGDGTNRGNFIAFVQELGYQHVEQYFNLLDIPQIWEIFSQRNPQPKFSADDPLVRQLITRIEKSADESTTSDE